MAKVLALTYSLDPSTKTGAIIAGSDGSIVGDGYNRFAWGVAGSPLRYANRDLKIACILHCEEVALFQAWGKDLTGCTLYTWPFMSCAKCAGLVIEAGIKRCVAPIFPAGMERWKASMDLAVLQFNEAGVELCLIDME